MHDPTIPPLPRAPGRSARFAIVTIKLVHSAIFFVNTAAIFHIFVAGLHGRPTRWTRPALVVIALEVLALAVNRGQCPLTRLVERLGATNGRVSDIFLPRALADRIPQLCTPPLLIGLVGLAMRRR